MANWNNPTLASTYTAFRDDLDGRLDDLALGLPDASYTGLPTGSIAWKTNKWQKWSGSAWVDLRNYSAATPEYYDIAIQGTAQNIRGTAGVQNGGTGHTTYTIGDLLVGGNGSALNKLSTIVGNNVLLSSGLATSPSWGKVGLTTHITGVLPTANGGLGTNTVISGLVKGSGSSYVAAVAGIDYAAASHTHDYIPTTGDSTISGNLSIISATSTKTLTIGSSGGYIYGSSTTYGITKSGGGTLNFTVDNGNLYTSGTFTSGGAITVSSGDITVSSGSLSTSGDITASGSITSSSDIRLKSNINTIESALSKVLNLRGVSYTKAGKPEIGVIAQEIEKVIPEVVCNTNEYKSVAYGNLVALLIEAIKELNQKLENVTR